MQMHARHALIQEMIVQLNKPPNRHLPIYAPAMLLLIRLSFVAEIYANPSSCSQLSFRHQDTREL